MISVQSSLLIALLLAVLVTARLPAPCFRCVGHGAPCFLSSNFDQCTYPFVCRKIPNGNNTACILPQKPGDECDTKLNDCPSNYGCDPTDERCVVTQPWGQLNDGCSEDEQCVSGLGCVGGTCQNKESVCTSDVQCGLDEYCMLTECKKRSTGDCTTTPCTPDLYCETESITSRKCKAYFTKSEGSECGDVKECEPGLRCSVVGDDTKATCNEPVYNLITKYGALWAPCNDPYNSAVAGGFGCRCNLASRTMEMAVELSDDVYHPVCKVREEILYDCLRTNECKALHLNGDSCVRKYCRAALLEYQYCPSGNPTIHSPLVCGASNLAMVAIAIIFAILL